MSRKYYSEMITYPTFEERFEYLKLGGSVGRSTFGFDRYINQKFYKSSEWLSVRNEVITRDYGCDLGVPGFEIHAEILIHHINPMTVVDIYEDADWILDPEFLITTTHRTHNAIHYAAATLTPRVVAERSPGDTKLW